MSDALGPGKVPRGSPPGRQQLGALGRAPGSRTSRPRESAGLGTYLRRGILVGGLVWIGLWLAAGRNQAPDPESAADAPEEQVVAVVETPVTPDLPAEATPVPAVETPAAAPLAPTALGETVATRLDAVPPPAVPVVSAILMTEGRRLAVVDGRVLGAGQGVGPWVLVSVNRDTVVLRDRSGVEHVVSLGHE